MVRILNSAAKYFSLVFATGFLLGILRTLFVTPHLGERWAELLEMPFMFVAMMVVVKWIFCSPVPIPGIIALAVGGIALAMMLAAEALLVIVMLDVSVTEYLVQRDPVSGTVYALMLLVFAILPWAVTHQTNQSKRMRATKAA